MNNQPCMVRPTLIDLNSDELYYYPFIVSMDKYDGSCNTAEDPFCRICAPNKIENVNLKAFNMITGKNESKILAKRIACECRYEFAGRKCNSRQKCNNDECQCQCEKPIRHALASATKIVRLANTWKTVNA